MTSTELEQAESLVQPFIMSKQDPKERCQSCYKRKCYCDQRQPKCGACFKKQMRCIPLTEESIREIEQQAAEKALHQKNEKDKKCDYCHKNNKRCEETRPCSSCNKKGLTCRTHNEWAIWKQAEDERRSKAVTGVKKCSPCNGKRILCDGETPCGTCKRQGTRCYPQRKPEIPKWEKCIQCKASGYACEGAMPCNKCQERGMRSCSWHNKELTKTYYHYFNLENRPSAKLFRVEADKEDEFTRTNCIQCRYSYYPENMGSTECNGKEPCNNCLRRGNDKCTFVRGHDLIRCYINETRPKIERFKQRLLLLDEDAEDCEEKDLDKDIELISDGDQDLNDLIDSSLSSSKRKLQSFAQEDDKGGVLSKKSRVQLIVNELEPVTRA